MAGSFLQARVTRDVRERAEQAASDCNLTVGEWVREVVKGALELHFGLTVPSDTRPDVVYHVDATGCTCPGFEHHGHCRHLALLRGEEAQPTRAELEAEREDYEAALADAVPPVPLQAHPPPTPTAPSPRDCPHLPPYVAGRCRRCGLRLAQPARMGVMRRVR